jgi:hypothetical protein
VDRRVVVLIALSAGACGVSGGPPDEPGFGTLFVSIATTGDDPDPDGYRLAIDDRDTVDLAPTQSRDVEAEAGSRTVTLLGVAGHCLVAPSAIQQVDIAVGERTAVEFLVDCPATGASVAVTTTGLDYDPDGYFIVADGSEVDTVHANATALLRLDPGTRTIGLAGLAPNCSLDGVDSYTVTVVAKEVVPVAFAVACVATSGVVAIRLSGNGVGNAFRVSLDDAAAELGVFQGTTGYLRGVPGGDHVISLSPPENCSVEGEPQRVSIVVGGLVRDTADAAFTVDCRTLLRVTAPTSGPVPGTRYSVWRCFDEYYCRYGPTFRLGSLAPNDTLSVLDIEPGSFSLLLQDVPPNCTVTTSNPTRTRSLEAGQLLSVQFSVRCT